MVWADASRWTEVLLRRPGPVSQRCVAVREYFPVPPLPKPQTMLVPRMILVRCQACSAARVAASQKVEDLERRVRSDSPLVNDVKGLVELP